MRVLICLELSLLVSCPQHIQLPYCLIILLIYLAPTKPPNDFDCQPESATSIFCEWGAIPQYHQRGELLYYQITYRPYGRGRISGSSYWQNITIHFTQRYHTIDDLEVFTRYEFEIQGCTMAGAGPVAWAQAKTHEGGNLIMLCLVVL